MSIIRKILAATLLLLCSTTCMAQTSKKEIERIKNDPNIVWGQGEGETREAASKAALGDLMSKITVNVSQSTTISENEVSKMSGHEAESSIRSVVETYTQGVLTNVQVAEETVKAPYRSLRYISKKELNALFNDREEKAKGYVYEAINAEKKGKIDDALRYYYWALCLLKSVQYPDRVMIDMGGSNLRLTQWIPMQMNDIFNNIEPEVAEINGNKINLFFKYKEEPVTSLDFKYYDGLEKTNFNNTAKNGVAQIELRDSYRPTDNLTIYYEYAFKNQARSEDKYIADVMDLFHNTTLSKATVNVDCKNKAQQKAAIKDMKATAVEASAAPASLAVKKVGDKEKAIKDIVDALKDRSQKRKEKLSKVRSYFTDGGADMFEKLLQYGNASLIGEPQYVFYTVNERTVCRSIPMQFNFQNNRRSFKEDVTFTFNSEGKIESLAFALEQDARKAIFDPAKEWDNGIRMTIATFLENYKTAFALGRVDYIESLFNDDAIIITGHVFRVAPKTVENQRFINSTIVKTTRQSKTEYIANLKKSFNSKEYINLQFTDSDVLQLSNPDWFGMMIHQRYYSSNYADDGFLYLLVDFKNADTPEIYVRTWQPERDPSLTKTLEKSDKYYGLFNANYF